MCVCVCDWNYSYGGPGVELSAHHDDFAAVFHIFMFDQVLNAVYLSNIIYLRQGGHYYF